MVSCPDRLSGKRRLNMTVSKLNREWHLSHRMPKNPTLEQRLEWHLEHAKNCQCRRITGKLAEEMKKRGMMPSGS